MLADMQFVYEQLLKQCPEHHLLVYGRSMGSGFATKIAADNSPRYLILDAPYYSFIKVAERFIPFLPHKWWLRYKLRTDQWIRKVNCHTYIIHGTKDWLIPITQSEKLQAINPHKITLIRIHGGGIITYQLMTSTITLSETFSNIKWDCLSERIFAG